MGLRTLTLLCRTRSWTSADADVIRFRSFFIANRWASGNVDTLGIFLLSPEKVPKDSANGHGSHPDCL